MGLKDLGTAHIFNLVYSVQVVAVVHR